MFKPRAALLTLIFLLAFGPVQAATLRHIRFAHYPEKIRAVLDFDDEVTYHTNEARNKIDITLNNVSAGPEISNYVELNDLIVRYFEVERMGPDLRISIPLLEPVEYNIFYLNAPPRLVIDFSRNYVNIVYGGPVADGVEFFQVKQGMPQGAVTSNVLKVNINKAEVVPALAKKKKAEPVESFFNFLLPWTRKDEREGGFCLDQLSDILSDNSAIAGTNGTFFANNGAPLGALIIDGELTSSFVYDRTAFFVDQNNRPFIDNLYLLSDFLLPNNTRYTITGINQGRGSDDIIMYTSAWGKTTRAGDQGIEAVVRDGKVAEINIGNSKIPDDGYVLSVGGPALETFRDNVKVGDKIDSQIRIVPYTNTPEKVSQLISGGPRLVKDGMVYISKHEEKFRSDIAKGRAARTAIGITKQGDVLLVAVDGHARDKKKNPASIGMTLEELSLLMVSLGAQDALNLDGGSSTTMVINNQVVNRPTAGWERGISNAVLIRPKKP